MPDPIKEETPPATPPETPPATPPPVVKEETLTPDQTAALEKQTGFKKEQLATVGLLVQAGIDRQNQSKVLEGKALESARGELVKAGISATEVSQLEPEMQKEADNLKLTLEQRQNPVIMQNVFWIVKGKVTSGAIKLSGRAVPPAAQPSRIIHSGVDMGGTDAPNNPGAGAVDLSDLDEHSKSVFKRYNFKTREEWDRYSSRNLDSTHERDWQPKFSGR